MPLMNRPETGYPRLRFFYAYWLFLTGISHDRKAGKCYNGEKPTPMSLLSPSSIAVIGASATPGKVGHDIVQNLVTQGYKGKIYPVNPKGREILGLTAYASVQEIGQNIDLAIIVIPAAGVPAVLDECGANGIRNAVIITAGFKESHSEAGEALEKEVIAIAKKHGIALVGPNCLGILRPGIGMNASFAKNLPPRGNVTLVSQSGATAVGIMDLAPTLGIGFASVFSIGNKSAMDECDYLELCADDPETQVIGLYLESIERGRRFLKIAREVCKKKPVVLLKSGVSALGRKAASSHTGALAGSEEAIDALCIQSGMKRARSMEEFLDLLATFSTQPPLLTDGIAVVTNAGGPGILATDIVEREKLLLPGLSPDILATLKTKLPDTASTQNPIDLIGDAKTDRYEAALAACRDDTHVDGIVVILTPQIMTPAEDIARAIVETMRHSPLMPVTACFMGGQLVEGARSFLRAHGIPVFDTPERAVRAIAALRRGEEPEESADCVDDDRKRKAASILDGKTGLLPEDDTRSLLTLFGLPLPAQSVATTRDEAASMADAIGYPVVAKISSPDIVHKTDVGGVVANLKDAQAVRAAYDTILANVKRNVPDAAAKGVLIQKFLPAGDEFIVGAVRDASFGPLIMAGLGGIYTELFKDASVRIGPVTLEQAYRMLERLTSWKLLKGMRGKSQSDIDALAALIVNVSDMLCACPRIKEFDLNPVLVSAAGVAIADAKVILG